MIAHVPSLPRHTLRHHRQHSAQLDLDKNRFFLCVGHLDHVDEIYHFQSFLYSHMEVCQQWLGSQLQDYGYRFRQSDTTRRYLQVQVD